MNWDKEWALQAHTVKLLRLSKKDPKWWSQLCMKEHVQDNMVEIQKQTIIPQEKSCAEIPLNGVWKAPEVWMIVHLSMLSPCVYNSRESPKHKGGVVLSKKDKSVWSRGQTLTLQKWWVQKKICFLKKPKLVRAVWYDTRHWADERSWDNKREKPEWAQGQCRDGTNQNLGRANRWTECSG